MSGLSAQLLAVLANGWLAASALLLLALAVDRPALLPPRARHLGLLASIGTTVLLALGGGAGWGREAAWLSAGARGIQDAAIAVGPGSPAAAWLAPVWMAVALALLVREAGGHLRLRCLRRTCRPAAAGEREAASLPDGLPLLVGADGSPLALGLVRAAVYLPERCFRDLSPGSLRAVAGHEAAHARWRDPATWALARLARIVLWPVAPLWVLERRLHRASEEAADAAAAAESRLEARAEYCRTLLAVASWSEGRRWSRGAPAIAAGRLERRLRAVLRPRRPGRRQAAVAAAVTLATLALLAALPWARPERVYETPALGRELDSEAFLGRLEEAGVPVAREGKDRIRIVIPAGDERVERIVRETVREERRP